MQEVTFEQEQLQRIEIHRAAQVAEGNRNANKEAAVGVEKLKRQGPFREHPVGGGGCRRDGVLVDCLATP